jgi:hypothetical protein
VGVLSTVGTEVVDPGVAAPAAELPASWAAGEKARSRRTTIVAMVSRGTA